MACSDTESDDERPEKRRRKDKIASDEGGHDQPRPAKKARSTRTKTEASADQVKSPERIIEGFREMPNSPDDAAIQEVWVAMKSLSGSTATPPQAIIKQAKEDTILWGKGKALEDTIPWVLWAEKHGKESPPENEHDPLTMAKGVISEYDEKPKEDDALASSDWLKRFKFLLDYCL